MANPLRIRLFCQGYFNKSNFLIGKPFDMLSEKNTQFQKQMAALPKKNDHFEFWPSTDSNRGQSG